MKTVTLCGRVTAADRARTPVMQVPFEVPPGVTRLDVCYRFDEGHVLDLGLVDPRFGPFPSRAGFRGWSGGARRHIFVATDDATPGYLPGPIPAGTWHVLLGLARVDGTCGYSVDVTLDRTPRDEIAPYEPIAHATPGAGWFKGDWQTHTDHSDARGSLVDLTTAARERGLDYVAVTDHNTVSHHRAIARLRFGDLLVVPGEEITTHHGHANVWGARGWVDFRAHDDAAMERVVSEAHALGGVFSVNHPKAQPGCLGCDWEYTTPTASDCFEVWQGPWPFRNWESLTRYDALLREGRQLTLVGGSDRHQPAPPERDPDDLRVGSPTTWVWAEALSVEGLLEGLRRGRVCVSEGPGGPRLDLSGPDTSMGGILPSGRAHELRAEVQGASGDVLRWLGPTGVLRSVDIEGDPFEDVWTVHRTPAYLRAEVVARDPEPRFRTWANRLASTDAAGPKIERLKQELIAARQHPWVRCLSNPLYGSNSRGAVAEPAARGSQSEDEVKQWARRT